MEFSIETPRKRLLLIGSCVIAAILIFQAAEMWIAFRRVASGQLDSMRRGAALLPENGEAWDRVGRFLQFDFANPDPLTAISSYQEAVRDDPNSSYYWMDLASVYEDVGYLDRAQEAFQRAQAAYPISALVAWNYGNFLIRRRADSEGYAKIQQAVRADPKLLPLAISRTWRSTQDVKVLLDQALPPTQEAYLQALAFFTSINQPDAGLLVWQRLISQRKPFALADIFPFIDKLIADDRSDDALHVWNGTLSASGLRHDELANGSVVWNGDFARDFDNGGFGWRWDAPLGASISFDSPPSGAGGRSIRLDFGGGSNLTLDMPAQFVPVDPNRSYRFHASLRTDRIATESGVRFYISDPNHSGAVDLLTDNFTGSRPWASLDLNVATGPQTHFLLIRLIRSPSRLFDNKLSGTAWIADVSLVPSSALGLQSP
jgi:tetratricopeptide (TPR) repeat protein